MAELCKLEIEVRLPEGEKLNSLMGSVFHGLLMDIAGADVAAWLHQQSSCRPFSQCVFFDKEKNISIWRICTLSETGFSRIVLPLLDSIGKNFQLKQKGYSIGLVREISKEEISYQELMDSVFMAEDAPLGGELSFLTTASFKKDNRYVLWPEIYLFFQSLINHWNEMYPASSISGHNIDKDMADSCYITKYNLRSQKYSVNSGDIYGFGGNMRLKLSGNDMTKRLMQMLLIYSQYAGIGIKTALGMGAVNFQELKSRFIKENQ